MSIPFADIAAITTLAAGLGRFAERLADWLNTRREKSPGEASLLQMLVIWGVTIAFVAAVALVNVFSLIGGVLQVQTVLYSTLAIGAILVVPLHNRLQIARMRRMSKTLAFEGIQVYFADAWTEEQVRRYANVGEESGAELVHCRSCSENLPVDTLQTFQYRGITVPYCGKPACLQAIQKQINDAIGNFQDGKEIIVELLREPSGL